MAGQIEIDPESLEATIGAYNAACGEGAFRALEKDGLATRGLDLPGVRHVVLYDFPRDGVEYLRRVGRVTRGGRAPGRVTSLVLGRQLTYARALMKIDERGEQIDLEVHG